MFRGIIYKTTNNITGKIYVGQDLHNKVNYLGSGTILKQSIYKHGRENFSKEVLEHCTSIEHMCELEIFWIKELDSRNPLVGYNITPGGEFGNTMSMHPRKKEIIQKIKNTSNKNQERKKTSIQKGVNTRLANTEKHRKSYEKANNKKRQNPEKQKAAHKQAVATRRSNPNYEQSNIQIGLTLKSNPEKQKAANIQRLETINSNPKKKQKSIDKRLQTIKNNPENFLKGHQKSNKANEQQITIDNILYSGIKATAILFCIERHELYHRLASNKYPTYIRISQTKKRKQTL